MCNKSEYLKTSKISKVFLQLIKICLCTHSVLGHVYEVKSYVVINWELDLGASDRDRIKECRGNLINIRTSINNFQCNSNTTCKHPTTGAHEFLVLEQ